MESVTHHGTPYYPWDSLGTDMFVSYPQTTEIWEEAQAMDAPPLCPSDDLDDTTTNPYITELIKVSGKP